MTPKDDHVNYSPKAHKIFISPTGAPLDALSIFIHRDEFKLDVTNGYNTFRFEGGANELKNIINTLEKAQKDLLLLADMKEVQNIKAPSIELANTYALELIERHQLTDVDYKVNEYLLGYTTYWSSLFFEKQ